jgi:protein phosphatase
MVNVEIHATSHVGRVRRGNEDNYLLLNISLSKAWTNTHVDEEFVIESQNFEVDDNGVIIAVSDGMGGALAGEVASKMAVETISSELLKEDVDKTLTAEEYERYLITRLYHATVFANSLIHHQGRTEAQYQGMGATFTGIGISPKSVDIVQVGDSRAYLIRNSKIYQITKDQSLVQQLIDAQQISPEEAETHTLKNVILQALGAQNEIFPVPARFTPQQGDVLLICSDGLSNKVNAASMQRIVVEHYEDLEMACADLVTEANDAGGEDNITVILAKISGEELAQTETEELQLEILDLANIHDTMDQDLEETDEDTAEII